MLVADDVILTSHCRAGLQRQIDILKHSAGSFSMTMTLIKTKIAVFRREKRGEGGFWQQMKCGDTAIRTYRLLTGINIWVSTSPPGINIWVSTSPLLHHQTVSETNC